MQKRDTLLVLLGYTIWGVQPLFWRLLSHLDSVFVLCCRVIWGAIFTVSFLFLRKRLPEMKALLLNKQKMKFLIPAVVFLMADWLVFIIAVQVGQVLDASLGYYLGPLVAFVSGILIFHEKPNKFMIIAAGLAFFGVLFSIVRYGSVPVFAIIMMLATNIYAVLKRFAQVEPLVSIAAETTVLSPIALLFILLFRMGDHGLAALGGLDYVLLIASGIVTAVPMVLFSIGVLRLPFLTLAFTRYVSPTLSLFCGLLLGEAITIDKWIMFSFIWVGLIIYTYSLVVEERKKNAAQEAEHC